MPGHATTRGLAAGTLALSASACFSAAAAASPISADGGWARAPAGAGDTMAAYFTLHGGDTPDRLVAVETPVAGMAMLHESGSDNGVSTMRMLDGVDIPAHGTVTLRPGGLHVMLDGLVQRPAAGASIRMVLRFAHAPAIGLAVGVRPPGAPGP